MTFASILTLTMFAIAFSPSGSQDVTEPLPILAMNSLDVGQFQFVIVNSTDKPVFVGELHSALGFDQYQFIVKRDDREFVLKRDKKIWINADKRTSRKVAPGGFYVVRGNLLDGTWDINEADKSVTEWKSIKVVYQPKDCVLAETRRNAGICEERFESSFVAIQPSK